MKGDVSLPVTSSSSEPSRAEDALLRDQAQLGSTQLGLCGVRILPCSPNGPFPVQTSARSRKEGRSPYGNSIG